jgi:hypothetical protein
MRINSRTRSFTPALVAQVLIAATLVAALVSSTVPPGLTSSGHLCTMECCAGKPPHEAGSCMHGSCEVNFSISKPPTPPKEQEAHCGASKAQVTEHARMHTQDAPAPIKEDPSAADHQHDRQTDSLGQEQARKSSSQQTTSVAASVLTKPCPPDCGAWTLSYSSQSRPRESAALSYANKPRPPSSTLVRRGSGNIFKTLEALYRRSPTRGPPPSFS